MSLKCAMAVEAHRRRAASVSIIIFCRSSCYWLFNHCYGYNSYTDIHVATIYDSIGTIYTVCIPCTCIGDVYMISYASGDHHACALFSFLYICNVQLFLLCWLHSYTYSNPCTVYVPAYKFVKTFADVLHSHKNY